MMDVAQAKPPAPLVTRVMQILGVAALGFGGWALATGPGCEELECLVWVLGAYLAAWGLIALLSGIRGPLGLVFLIGAIVLALGISWVEPFYGLIGLLIVGALVSASKERLAPYYRRHPKADAR